jgi:hypothetical protein
MDLYGKHSFHSLGNFSGSFIGILVPFHCNLNDSILNLHDFTPEYYGVNSEIPRPFTEYLW